jgi:hypothetical protein
MDDLNEENPNEVDGVYWIPFVIQYGWDEKFLPKGMPSGGAFLVDVEDGEAVDIVDEDMG